MRIAIQDRPDFGCVVMRSAGRFSGEAICALIRSAHWIAPLSKPGPVLHDMTAVDFDVPSAEIRMAARAPLPDTAEELRVAFVVGDRLGFGMMRMFCLMRERPPLLFEVFLEGCAAASWLGVPEGAGRAAARLAQDRAAAPRFAVLPAPERISPAA